MTAILLFLVVSADPLPESVRTLVEYTESHRPEKVKAAKKKLDEAKEELRLAKAGKIDGGLTRIEQLKNGKRYWYVSKDAKSKTVETKEAEVKSAELVVKDATEAPFLYPPLRPGDLKTGQIGTMEYDGNIGVTGRVLQIIDAGKMLVSENNSDRVFLVRKKTAGIVDGGAYDLFLPHEVLGTAKVGSSPNTVFEIQPFDSAEWKSKVASEKKD